MAAQNISYSELEDEEEKKISTSVCRFEIQQDASGYSLDGRKLWIGSSCTPISYI